MARKIKIANHLSSEELKARYKESKDPVERTRYHALWRVSLGESGPKVATLLGIHPQTVRNYVASYNKKGPEAMRDLRHDHLGGRQPYLDQLELKELNQLLLERHPDGGLWNGAKVREWLIEKVGHSVAENLGWRYLKRLSFTSQAPRPRSAKADMAAQAAFKK